MENRVYLYAFDEECKVVLVRYLKGEAITIQNLIAESAWMRHQYPFKVRIYAIDNWYGLYRDYQESIKTLDFATHVKFMDTVASKGIRMG